MAEFPIACNLEGDYGYKVLVVDETESVADVIQKAVDQIVGVLVAPFPPGTVLKLRLHGGDAPLADELTVKEANFAQMETVEIYRAG
jgi:hypothetical protein